MHKITHPNYENLTGHCSICGPVSIRVRDYRFKKNGEKVAECRKQYIQRNRKYYVETGKGSPSYLRNNKRRKGFRVTPEIMEQYKQALYCDSCGDSKTKALHIDHDHQTNRVRGFLCHWCNVGLGYFKDSPQRLEKAIAYLQKTSAQLPAQRS